MKLPPAILPRLLALLLLALPLALRAEPLRGGWGIDAAVGCPILLAPDIEASRPLLGQAALTWIRGRGFDAHTPPNLPPQSGWFGAYHIIGFAGGGVPVEQPGDQLPRDLLAVYRAAREQASALRGRISAWEMTGEPDVGYCRDLPDRATAYMKAQYLGLHDGDPDAVVLMGALALPPGPWLARAARNRLLDYTDALNLHFYGNADDLAATLHAHERFADRAARRDLPVWITECGIEPVMPGELPDAARQRIHADFMVSTAAQARADSRVAVFMPFIFSHEGDPNALVLGTDRPFAAWTAYADYTRRHPWPAKRPLRRPPETPGRLIALWSPDNSTCTPHKVSGAYRFIGDRPMRGELRVYNLGARAELVGCRLSDVGGRSWPLGDSALTVPAQGMIAIPVTIPPTPDFTRHEIEFTVHSPTDKTLDQVVFNVEPQPGLGGSPASPRPGIDGSMASAPSPTASTAGSDKEDGARNRRFTTRPLALAPLPDNHPPQPPILSVPMLPGTGSGPWSAANGQVCEDLGGGRLRVFAPTGKPDRLRPPYVATALRDLPKAGWLHVRSSRDLQPGTQLRIDLLDRDGQRFCIWENFGQGYGETGPELWLNLDDFHVHFFGRCKPDPRFRPELITELQVRPYLAPGSEPLDISLEWCVEKR